MKNQRTFSLEFKRQVIEELLSGEDRQAQIFVTDFLRHLSVLVVSYLDDERKNEVRKLIEESIWGYNKLKRKFLDELFHENSRVDDF